MAHVSHNEQVSYDLDPEKAWIYVDPSTYTIAELDAAIAEVQIATWGSDDITALTINATGDTSAGDNSAQGYTASEGCIITGQGSTSDVTLKNDADANVFTIPTGKTFGQFEVGCVNVALTVTPNSGAEAASLITAGVTAVTVAAPANDTNDFIVLPAFADIPIGHQIVIDCASGGAFELRTVASSNTTINGVDSDGPVEYLCTDTETITVTKHADGYVATALSAAGAVVTAVVPD